MDLIQVMELYQLWSAYKLFGECGRRATDSKPVALSLKAAIRTINARLKFLGDGAR